MNWYLKVIRDNYANFVGRARRQEYWMFAFINLIIALILSMLDTVLFRGDTPILSGIYGLAILIPGIAVAVRRLHDTDRTGWWLLLALIPVVGTIILIIMMCIDSTPGPNRYGANPKHIGNTTPTLPT
ncbi:DUF805 domain-containing protein [Alkanindiges sp. WGS2144]|uniref:DUF805 domain-containing protein n=1 Tax=Alkanindiges sp. WGS2144 TaxID=3366808 RepID=UPI00375170B8